MPLQVDREIEERARGFGAAQDDRIDSADGVRDADAHRVKEEANHPSCGRSLWRHDYLVPLYLFHPSSSHALLQVNKLRDSIQSITRTTGPLSSCVDFVQEVRLGRVAPNCFLGKSTSVTSTVH